jgi:hypothetical protein
MLPFLTLDKGKPRIFLVKFAENSLPLGTNPLKREYVKIAMKTVTAHKGENILDVPKMRESGTWGYKTKI